MKLYYTPGICSQAVHIALRETGTPFDPNSADSTREAVQAKLAVRFAELDALLKNQQFLAGEFSVADAYAFTIVNWTRAVGISLEPYPHLRAFLTRVRQRPHVREALQVEGLAN